MKRLRIWSCLLVVVAAMVLSGCAYIHTKTPFDSDLNETELGAKRGTADAHSVLWLVAWGDASYAAAAQNGDIRILKHADQETLTVLFGLYTRWRVIVYGD